MLPRQLGSIFGSILDVGTIEPESGLDIDGRADEDATGPGCSATWIQTLLEHATWVVENEYDLPRLSEKV